jgi:flagellar motor component MotA
MNENDRERLARFEEKLDSMFTYEKERDKILNKRIDDHETRIRAVEAWKSKATGVVAALMGLITLLEVLKRFG